MNFVSWQIKIAQNENKCLQKPDVCRDFILLVLNIKSQYSCVMLVFGHHAVLLKQFGLGTLIWHNDKNLPCRFA